VSPFLTPRCLRRLAARGRRFVGVRRRTKTKGSSGVSCGGAPHSAPSSPRQERKREIVQGVGLLGSRRRHGLCSSLFFGAAQRHVAEAERAKKKRKARRRASY